MAFQDVVTDETGVLYAITDGGDLVFYRYDDPAQDGSGTWANGGEGRTLGGGWGGFDHVVSGGDGILYAIDGVGDLYFYQDLARDGTVNWAHGGVGQKIGSGWGNLAAVISSGDGILYAVTAGGALLFYRDLARNGTSSWANGGVPQHLGTGWGKYSTVVSGGQGIIYAVQPDGELYFYQDQARDGTVGWAHGGTGQQIGTGWNLFDLVTGGGNGVLYGFRPDGFLLWYRDLDRTGTASWDHSGIGQRIGSGWQIDRGTPAIHGYSVPFTAGPGDDVAFKVSAEVPYTVTYERLRLQADGALGITVGGPLAMPAGVKKEPPIAWQHGCGWDTDFTLRVPADWQSGLYAAQCVGTADPSQRFSIVFVVTPAAGATADFAVLANTNTWTAYNGEGGRSQYTTPNGAVLSFERPNPAVDPTTTVIDHLVRGEMWILGWLEDHGYRFHVFSDLDFHRGIPTLSDYRGLVLHTHPEYWTMPMRDNLDAYLAGGGRLVYLGGNGLYEVVDLDKVPQAMELRRGDADNQRDLFREAPNSRPERAVLGVGYESTNWMTFGAYRTLMESHPFMAGSGLQNGDLFGETGLNGGGASGWEMDTSIAAPDGVAPANIQVLARGNNPVSDGTGATSYGADMTYYDTPAGGFVFSAGSLSFGGSLVQDARLETIVKNALDACLA